MKQSNRILTITYRIGAKTRYMQVLGDKISDSVDEVIDDGRQANGSVRHTYFRREIIEKIAL